MDRILVLVRHGQSDWNLKNLFTGWEDPDLTGKGVIVFDKNGTQIEQIEVPESGAANVCFGGKEMKTLFITARKGLYSVQMRVKGDSGR